MVGNTNVTKKNVLDYASAKTIAFPAVGNSYTFTEDGYYFGVLQVNVTESLSAVDVSICINSIPLSFGYSWDDSNGHDRWPAMINVPVKSGDILSLLTHGTGYTLLTRVSTFIPYK